MYNVYHNQKYLKLCAMLPASRGTHIWSWQPMGQAGVRTAVLNPCRTSTKIITMGRALIRLPFASWIDNTYLTDPHNCDRRAKMD